MHALLPFNKSYEALLNLQNEKKEPQPSDKKSLSSWTKDDFEFGHNYNSLKQDLFLFISFI